ncbi:rhox homeobox family member 2-like, partial [Sigmodon hispidus]
MGSNQGDHPSVIGKLVQDPDENQEQQLGENVMALSTGEEGDKKEHAESKPAQDELDQGEPVLGALAQDEPAQEEHAQVSVSHEASGAVEEEESKLEEMGGEEASAGISGPMDNGNHVEADHGCNVQQQPQQEAAIPECNRRMHDRARVIVHHRPRFTRSQLQDLEELFQQTHYPSLSA